jgi:hypothetical protein
MDLDHEGEDYDEPVTIDDDDHPWSNVKNSVEDEQLGL